MSTKASMSFLVLSCVILLVHVQAQAETTEKEDIVIGFFPLSYTVSEADGRVPVTIISSVPIPPTNLVILQIHTRDNTALLQKDYRNFTDFVIFSSGESKHLYQVDVFEDEIVELPLESFSVEIVLDSIVGDLRVVLIERIANIFIRDSSKLLFHLVPTTIHVKEDDGPVVMEITKSGQSERSVTILVQTIPGSATASSDFTPLKTSILFKPDDTSHTFTVHIVKDFRLEEDELFTVELGSDGDRAVQLLNSTQVCVVNVHNDDNVILHFSSDFYTVIEQDENVTINVIMRGLSDLTVSVRVATLEVDAVDGTDFNHISTTLTFEPGVNINHVVIDILDDHGVVNYPRRVMVDLFSEQSGVVIGGPHRTSVVIMDDDSVTIDFLQKEYSIERGENSVTLTLSKVGINRRPVSVYLSIVSIGAQGTSDHDEMVTFEPDTAIFPVVVQLNDGIITQNEFYVQLVSIGPGVKFGQSAGRVRVRIHDNDNGFSQRNATTRICTVEDAIIINPFETVNDFNPLQTLQTSYTFHSTCEHILLASCIRMAPLIRVTADFKNSDLAIESLGIQVGEGGIIIRDDLSVAVRNLGQVVLRSENETEYANGITITENNDEIVVRILESGIIVKRMRILNNSSIVKDVTVISLEIPSNEQRLDLCGLCGTLDGVLVHGNRDDIVPTNHSRSDLEKFASSWKTNPGEGLLGQQRKECGFLHNDTIIGDPLFSAPLYDINEDTPFISDTSNEAPPFLCYEIHGSANTTFNLISDRCTSVNALYTSMDIPDNGNIISSIGVKAIDNNGQCIHITVSQNGNCTPHVSSERGVVSSERYNEGGVSVSKRRGNRVRVSVPNCEGVQLVMWVVCERVDGQEMIRLVVSRGVNLHPTSHGLIGQFWNIPIAITPVSNHTHPSSDTPLPDDLFSITVSPPSSSPRTFIGELYYRSWDLRRVRCYYAGNSQGGALVDYGLKSDSVIEGDYSDYIVESGLMGSKFKYAQFDDNLC